MASPSKVRRKKRRKEGIRCEKCDKLLLGKDELSIYCERCNKPTRILVLLCEAFEKGYLTKKTILRELAIKESKMVFKKSELPYLTEKQKQAVGIVAGLPKKIRREAIRDVISKKAYEKRERKETVEMAEYLAASKKKRERLPYAIRKYIEKNNGSPDHKKRTLLYFHFGCWGRYHAFHSAGPLYLFVCEKCGHDKEIYSILRGGTIH